MPMLPPDYQEMRDREHLNLLSIFHYVVGGMFIVFSSFAIFHLVFGLLMVYRPEIFSQHGQAAPPAFVGILISALAVAAILLGWLSGAFTIYAGFCIKRRKHRILTLAVAISNVLFVPFGTILGIFTIIVLMRESVRRLYEPIP